MIAAIQLGDVAVDLVFKDIKNLHLSVYPRADWQFTTEKPASNSNTYTLRFNQYIALGLRLA